MTDLITQYAVAREGELLTTEPVALFKTYAEANEFIERNEHLRSRVIYRREVSPWSRAPQRVVNNSRGKFPGAGEKPGSIAALDALPVGAILANEAADVAPDDLYCSWRKIKPTVWAYYREGERVKGATPDLVDTTTDTCDANNLSRWMVHSTGQYTIFEEDEPVVASI